MDNSEKGIGGGQSISGDTQEAKALEKEIDLRKYLEVVIRRKGLIVKLVLAVTILTAIVSLFLPRVYEARASVMIMPSRIRSALSPAQITLDPEKSGEGEYIEQGPAISIPTHKALLKSNTVLERLLGLLKSGGLVEKGLAVEQLSDQLRVEAAEQTNILQLVAADNKAEAAKEIVNQWAREYARYSSEIILGEVKGSGDFILEQFKLAEENLVKAEKAVTDFDVKENIKLLEIELKENISQLESHYAKVCNLEFGLREKKNALMRVNDMLAVMTKDGVWLGAFEIKAFGEEYFDDETLNADQKMLRKKILKASLAFENGTEERNRFVNESKILLLREEVAERRKQFLEDKSLLSRIKQLRESTETNLKSSASLSKLTDFRAPVAERLSDSAVWEILSLVEGYNFFDARYRFLEQKVNDEGKQLQEMQRVLMKHEDRLRKLDETLERAKSDYDAYLGELKRIEAEKSSLALEISNMEFQLLNSRAGVKQTEGRVWQLKVTINNNKAKLAGLNRQLDVCRRTYELLSTKIEEARIARAMKLGEVKVVSTAFEPKYAVRPRKRRNVAIAGISSLMLGVFIAFFQEYWRKE